MIRLDKKTATYGFIVVSSLAVLVLIINKTKEALKYRIDTFKGGQIAYKSLDCPKAIFYLSEVEKTASFVLNKFDNLSDIAKSKIATCNAFIAANQQAKLAETGKDFSKALYSRYRFIEQRDRDELTQGMARHIAFMFSSYGVAKLSGRESCGNLEKMLVISLIPNVPANLPHFYDSCAKFYDKQQQPDRALDHRRRFLSFSPKHPLSKHVQIAVITSPNICSQAPSFQSIRNIASLPALMPVIYLNCSNFYYRNLSFPESKASLYLLRKYYPKHALAKVANDWIFYINKEIRVIKIEVYRSIETIKVKLELCIAPGVFGFGWIVDIWEFFTGKSCGLEEPLKDWERYANIIPGYGEYKQFGKAQRVYSLARAMSRRQNMNKLSDLVLDDQSLVELLKDEQSISLLSRHNRKLFDLVMPRLVQPKSARSKFFFLEYIR